MSDQRRWHLAGCPYYEVHFNGEVTPLNECTCGAGKKPAAPRELHFKTYLKPSRGVVYDMAKCSSDLWMLEQEWSFIEKSAYNVIQKQLEKERQANIDLLAEIQDLKYELKESDERSGG